MMREMAFWGQQATPYYLRISSPSMYTLAVGGDPAVAYDADFTPGIFALDRLRPVPYQ